MTRFFSPVLYLMDRVRLSYKFLLILCICLLPMMLLAYIILENTNGELERAKQELNGLTFIKPIADTLIHVAATRDASNNYLEGDTNLKSSLQKLHEKVDAELNNLFSLQSELNITLADDHIKERIFSHWESAKQASNSGDSLMSVNHYSHVIIQLIEYLNHAGYETHLLNDRNSHNAILANSVIRRIPVLTEATDQLRKIGAGVLAKGYIDEVSATKLAIFLDRIEFHHSTLGTESKDHKSHFPGNSAILVHAENVTSKFIQQTKALVQSVDKFQLSSKGYFALGSEAIDANNDVFDYAISTIRKSLEERVRQEKLVKHISLITILLTALALSYLLFGFYLSIILKLNTLHKAAEQIALGDLTIDLKLSTHDEIGAISSSINKIAMGVSQTIASLFTTSKLFFDVANRLTETSRITENSVSSQVGDSTTTGQSISDLSHSVQEVSNNISQAVSSTKQASDATIDGQRVVSKTIDSIHQLATGLEDVSTIISKLEKDSHEIGSILNVIQEIADQTNLLALNAAIEAARAGENGRGFAVVADEVRNLAQKTQNSILEIQTVIEQLQKISGEAVETMKLSSCRASESVEYAKNTGDVLQNITDIVSSINDMNQKISVSAEQQAATAIALDNNVTNMTCSADQSSAVAKSAYEDSTRVLALASETQSLLHRFKIDHEKIAAVNDNTEYMLFVWDDSFSLNLPEIDRQHKVLVGMINELNYHVKMKHDIRFVSRVLQGLLDYTNSHFGYEESLMERHGYEKLDEHKEKHKKLISQILDLKRRVDEEGSEVTKELLIFLTEWLAKHIKGTDRDYAAVLVKKGVDQRPTDINSSAVESSENIDLF